MSTVYFIAYDYPLPEINLKKTKKLYVMNNTIECEAGFAVEPLYYDSEGFIKKKYIYEVSLEADDSCVNSLRKYLLKNMENNSEAEIWSIGLGGDYTKHYKNRIWVKGLSPKENAMVSDDIDGYKENYVVPERRYITIETLSVEDISFILDNLSVCLIISYRSSYNPCF